ncbi:flagellar attachment zone protein 1-like [Pyrus x bretschneideri]|uniref:flagellar attachment zone protein 1-like n=1 Tax=Pyrus x bretschneideri TaxID=225117 RepID=UPI0005109288|nr:flagellar attachment zone protein 1-like [Pyrus x bretschneideri]
MAAETVASLQIPTTDEQVEKKTIEGEKAIEQDGVSLTKQNGGEVHKTEDLESLSTPSKPPAIEAEKAADAPAQDVPLVEETKSESEAIPDSQALDIPKHVVDAVESPIEVQSAIESVERELPKEVATDSTEIGQVEQPKIVGAPVQDVPLVEETKAENESIPDSETLNIPKQVADAVEIPAEVQSVVESVVREAPKEPSIDSIEVGQVEEPKIVDAPLSSVEAIEKPEEPLEVTSDEGSIAPVLEKIKDSKPEFFEVKDKLEEPNIVDAPLSSVEAIEKPEEPLEVTSDEGSIAPVVEKIKDSKPEFFDVKDKLEEPEQVEPEEIVQDETVKDEGSITVKAEPTRVLKEGKTETKDAPSLAVEEKTEQPKLVEQEKKHDEVGPEESVEVEKVKDEGSSVDKVEDSTVVEEAKNDEDNKPSLIENLEEASLSREAQIEVQEEGDASLPDVTEKLATEDEKKEISAVDVVEKLAEEPAVETEKVGEESVETKENEKSNVIPLDSTQIIKEDKNKESSGVDVVEKLGDEEGVELEKVGEKKVETAADGKRDLVTEDSIQPIIEEQRKELNGGDLIEKLVDEDVVKLENFGEENVAKDVITEDNEERNVISEDPTLPIEESKKKELSGSDVAEKLAEEAVVKVESGGEEMVAKNGRIEENEKINEKIEDSTQPIDVVEKVTEEAVVETEKPAEENETKNVKFEDDKNKTVLEEDVKNSITFPTEFIEKSFEGAAKDAEPAVETEAAEKIQNATPSDVETKTGKSAEEKPDEVSTAVEVDESEVKGEETVKTDADRLEKIMDEVAKPDQNVEPPPTKDGDQAKPPEDLPKEVPAKSSQKQSNNLLSKVKHSLVKAKKAIIGGKSPSSKNPAIGTKEDIKVK